MTDFVARAKGAIDLLIADPDVSHDESVDGMKTIISYATDRIANLVEVEDDKSDRDTPGALRQHNGDYDV